MFFDNRDVISNWNNNKDKSVKDRNTESFFDNWDVTGKPVA